MNMAIARITTNTTKEYPCTMCGASGNIVREGANPRLKCTQCDFMYDASDSEELVRRGEVPEGPPELPKDEPPPEEKVHTPKSEAKPIPEKATYNALKREFTGPPVFPRDPSHVFVSKNKKDYEFATEKTFKKTLLRWESSDKKYDVYQLMKFEYAVKVDVRN